MQGEKKSNKIKNKVFWCNRGIVRNSKNLFTNLLQSWYLHTNWRYACEICFWYCITSVMSDPYEEHELWYVEETVKWCLSSLFRFSRYHFSAGQNSTYKRNWNSDSCIRFMQIWVMIRFRIFEHFHDFPPIPLSSPSKIPFLFSLSVTIFCHTTKYS